MMPQMRIDFQIGVLLALAGIAIAVAVMAAPLYFDIPRKHLALFFWGGVVIGLGFLGLAIYIALSEGGGWALTATSNKIALYGMIVSGIFFFGFAAWFLWPQPRTNPGPSTANNLDRTILLDCSYRKLPEVIPENGVMAITLGPQMMAGITTTTLPAGARLNWDTKYYSDMVLMCRIQNFSSSAIINARVEFLFSYDRVITTESGTRSGESIEKVPISSPQFQLGSGSTSYADFYILNASDLYISFDIPTEVHFQLAGSPEAMTAKLIAPRTSGYIIPPRLAPPSAQTQPPMGNDNTLVGNLGPARPMGSGNTIVGATDTHGNTILNKPMAIGRDAHAGPGSIAIGAGANAGSSQPAGTLNAVEVQRRRNLIDGYLSDWRRSNDGHPPELRDLIDKATPYIDQRLSEDGEAWTLTPQIRSQLGYPKSRRTKASSVPSHENRAAPASAGEK